MIVLRDFTKMLIKRYFIKGFFLLGAKLEIRNFKEQFVIPGKICNYYWKIVIVGSYGHGVSEMSGEPFILFISRSYLAAQYNI